MEPSPTNRTPVPWDVKDTLVALGLVLGGTFVMLSLLRLLRSDGGPQENVPLITLAFAVLPWLMVLAVWLFGVAKYRASWHTLGISRPVGRWSMLLPWGALLVSLMSLGVYGLIVTALGVDFLLPEPIPPEVLGDGPYRLVNVVSIGIIGPLAEEIFFRGFMLAALVQPLGTLRGAAVGSAIFSAGHMDVGLLVPFFVSGLLLSWLYLRTRSIWPPFAAHAAQNLIAMSLVA